MKFLKGSLPGPPPAQVFEENVKKVIDEIEEDLEQPLSLGLKL